MAGHEIFKDLVPRDDAHVKQDPANVDCLLNLV